MERNLLKYILLAVASILGMTANASPDWNCDASGFEYDMTIFASLSINKEVVNPADYVLAVFCGDECRGVATVEKTGVSTYYYLRVRSNVKDGETISFRVYDSANDKEIESGDLRTTVEFQNQELLGYPSSPFSIEFLSTYTITTLDSEHGTIEGAGTYEYGSMVTLEAIPEEGYSFVKWSNGVTENPYTFEAKESLTIGATFSSNTYKLVFVIDGEVISESTVEYGAEVSAIEAPEKEGYTFDGWTGLPETMPAEDVTVTGSYSINSYKLVFVIDGEVISESDVEYGAEVSAIQAPEKEGYTFDGWSGLPETMPAEDVTVTGSYSINSYKLVFVIDGEVISESDVEYGAEVSAIEAPEKEGYTFDGWTGLPETMPAEDVTVTGSYSINSYKLVFVIDGEVISESTVEYGAEVSAIEAPEKEGYTFDGWTGMPETMPAQDVTVTGSYSINSYKLVFVIDGEVISESDVEYGAEVSAIQAPEKEGYTFDGWSGLPETMPAEDVTVTGSYTINTYSIYYYVDGELYYTENIEFGASITPIQEPTREGYDFSGWSEIPEYMPAHDINVYGAFKISMIEIITYGNVNPDAGIYDMQGRKISNMTTPEIINSLSSGLYIINGKKVYIKR